MSNFWQRALFGIVFVTVITAACYANYVSFFCLLAIIQTLSLFEYYSLFSVRPIEKFSHIFIANLLLFSIGIIDTEYAFIQSILYFVVALSLILICWNILRRNKIQAADSLALMLFGYLYIFVPIALFLIAIQLNISKVGYVWQNSLLLFILVWSSDTFAYVFGKSIGKKLLFPSLSPKKTIEGFLGSIVATAALSIVLHFFNFRLYPDSTVVWQVVFAVLLCFTGTLGDLFESSLKRKCGVKDSSKIFPGHGGALDRFDAFLFAAILYFCFVKIGIEFGI